MKLEESIILRMTKAMKKEILSYMKTRKFGDRDMPRAVRELIDAGLKVLGK